MTETLFLRLLAADDKDTALKREIATLRGDQPLATISHTPLTFSVNPQSFRQVPGSPFAYWVSEKIRRLFVELPPFENEDRTVKVGLQTSDDFRFVRLWWEVPVNRLCPPDAHPEQRDGAYCVLGNYQWFPFAKGGEYSPYYADLHLVVNWQTDGEEMKTWAGSLYNNSHWSRIIKNVELFFRPGLTFPSRTTSKISFRILPGGSIFAHKGCAVFTVSRDLTMFLSLMQSNAFESLIVLRMGAADAAARAYEVGIIQVIPIPDLSESNIIGLIRNFSLNCINLKRELDNANEISHIFYLPALLQTSGDTLNKRAQSWQQKVSESDHQLADYQRQIDEIAFQLYGIDGDDRKAIEATVKQPIVVSDDLNPEAETEPEAAEPATIEPRSLVVALVSYAIGCVVGRWDIRFATGEYPKPELPDPFAPLPVYSPGMLTPDSDLTNYPLERDQDGILVDDPDHPDDILRRIRNVLEVIWSDNADAIEQEACEILGVKDLRDYFHKPGNGGFWQDHIKRYSKSRRKAPIYWLLQSSKKSYALWLYYHRLDKDILFKAHTQYVEPKLNLETDKLNHLNNQRATLSGTALKKLEHDIEKQENLVSELTDFSAKLQRAAKLDFGRNLNQDVVFDPDLNDGVVLNIAPLWELTPWSEAKKYWQDLIQGKYEWSSIGKQLRAKGIVQC